MLDTVPLTRRACGVVNTSSVGMFGLQGMPFLALTAPPWAPVVGMATAELEADDDGEAPGTVALLPSMIWT